MKRVLSFLMMFMALLVSNANATAVLQGRVVGVSDGDSLTLLDAEKRQYKIRLQGIDAPEIKQAYGQKSKESLSKMVYGKTIQVHAYKKDRFGRTVGQVILGDIDICLEQVRRGLAWHFKDYQDEQSAEDRERYDRAEKQAREQGLGLWQDAAPVAPWVFRQRK